MLLFDLSYHLLFNMYCLQPTEMLRALSWKDVFFRLVLLLLCWMLRADWLTKCPLTRHQRLLEADWSNRDWVDPDWWLSSVCWDSIAWNSAISIRRWFTVLAMMYDVVVFSPAVKTLTTMGVTKVWRGRGAPPPLWYRHRQFYNELPKPTREHLEGVK